ncbi:hypothetical protein JKF63_02593 [Porcisia hertigi]|uniref:Uncharacterized protein n=1 Tax=Porcisia hertigi TaxID=2761500 RepID=A0A836I191_9TRYP|nr:hypothetical protein JKF63_02593 [Porcisia hertigi]
MSWVRVECSGGYRYVAPSHGRSAPQLNGMAQLCQSPLSIRELHTFSTHNDNAPAVSRSRNHDLSGGLGTDECVNACVMIDQRDLGGHLGITTVAVGDEDDNEQAASSPLLLLLLDRVFSVLERTNERGVQVLLDALCTRTPPPLTQVAISEAAIVREDDGGQRVPPSLWAARTQGKENSLKDITGSVSTSSNRQFLLKLTQSCPAVQEVAAGAVEALSVQPLSSRMTAATESGQAVPTLPQPAVAPVNRSPVQPSTALSESPISASVAARPPLSYAAALRRRSLLYFIPQGVVPLSLLAIHFELSASAMKWDRKARASSPGLGEANTQTTGYTLTRSFANATTDPRSSLHDILLEEMGCVHVGAPRAEWNLKSHGVSFSGALSGGRSGLLHCVSHLRRQGGKLLKKSSSWAAVAHTAEESGRLLVWAIARLLAGRERHMSKQQAADLHRLILHDLWFVGDSKCIEESTAAAGGGAPSTAQACMSPLVAVYSPSGLLFASEKFTMLLSHEEQVLVSAAAIDRLSRYSAPRNGSGFGPSAPAADALSWISWPLRVGEAEGTFSGAAVMDVLLITVGDALAFCLLFPRMSPSQSMQTSASLQSVQSLLESTVATARSRDPASSAMTTVPLTAALVFVCTHSTAPYTSTFHDALFAVTALEDTLNAGKRTSSGGTSNLPDGEQLGVAEHLRRLLLREASQSETRNEPSASVTVTNSPAPLISNAPRTEPQTAADRAAAENTRRRGTDGSGPPRSSVTNALHKIFSCLPPRHDDPGGGVASSRQVYVTAAQQQSSAYVNRLSEEARLLPSVPTPSTDMPQGRDLHIAALLAMPLEEMLCYVSALVTRNELGTLRPSYSLGLHSFFFLQQPAVAASVKHPRPTSARVPAPGAPKGEGDALAQRSAPPTRFGVSFARFRLQQSPCSPALIPEEWADAVGAPDGSGGQLTFFEDPSLLLKLSTQDLPLAGGTVDERSGEGELGETASGGAVQPLKGAGSADVLLGTQVSVIPVWSLLQAAPAESLTTGELSDADTDTIDSDSVEVADGSRGIHGSLPSIAAEDTQLVTSLNYTYSQRLRRRERPYLSLAATHSRARPASVQDASLTGMHPQLLIHTPQTNVTNTEGLRSKKSTVTKPWCRVKAVVNICGDITGARQSIVTRALQRHALSSSAEESLMSGAGAPGSGSGAPQASATVPLDSLPAEWEYAADAPPKMVDLCREVVWCQEAALALLKGAASLS